MVHNAVEDSAHGTVIAAKEDEEFFYHAPGSAAPVVIDIHGIVGCEMRLTSRDNKTDKENEYDCGSDAKAQRDARPRKSGLVPRFDLNCRHA